MTLTEDRPKRLTLADLEETCRSYPKHIRREKTENLPKIKPGIVFVKVPQTWLVDAPVREKMIDVVEDFLRQTERIVSVVLYASVIEEWKERAMLRNRHQFREFENPRHRFDQGKSWVLFGILRYRPSGGHAASLEARIHARIATPVSAIRAKAEHDYSGQVFPSLARTQSAPMCTTNVG